MKTTARVEEVKHESRCTRGGMVCDSVTPPKIFWSDGQGERERKEARVNTHPAIASQEHLMLHNRGGTDASPHGEGALWLTNPAAQTDAH